VTFNPDQERDDHGRWTGGGATAPEGQPVGEHPHIAIAENNPQAENVRRMSIMVENVSKNLGFPPTRITISDEDKKFMLNGKEYFYAGGADLQSGEVTLYSGHLDAASTEPTTAHEIMHEKFQDFMNDYGKERDEVFKDPGPPPNPNSENIWERRGGSDAVMKPDGTLREGYAEKYPLYQRMAEFDKAHSTEDLSKSDGITNYSKEWWKAWNEGTAHTEQAMHETLAEMSARNYVLTGPNKDFYRQTGRTKNYDEPAPEWKMLYDMVSNHWDEKHK